MKQPIIYDLAGIGIGPFNLGLAALAAPIQHLNCIFLDARPQFSWHEGMLLPYAKMQVPFIADLVTGADPTSQFSFLAYLKRTNRLYQFGVLDDNYILRTEYQAYCRWVAARLKSLCFNHQVSSITYDANAKCYLIQSVCNNRLVVIYARHIVIGVGSIPFIPPHLSLKGDTIIHSSNYLRHKTALLDKAIVTVIGSGQSAAEIFYDLLLEKGNCIRQLNWCTRSSRFHPMETAKLTQEMTSPDYIRHFHSLSPFQKAKALGGQQHLYKGINEELIAAIYQLLYRKTQDEATCQLITNAELMNIVPEEKNYHLSFQHLQTEKEFSFSSEGVVLATGYQPHIPTFLNGIKNRIRWDSEGRYEVNLQYAIDITGAAIFIQNAELHTHGFNTPDLGMGPYRNAIILNNIL